jgi:hypothetical protein
MPAFQAAVAVPGASVPAGPRINLGATENQWSPELFKWVVMFAFFGSIVTVGIYFLPTIIRYIRFL